MSEGLRRCFQVGNASYEGYRSYDGIRKCLRVKESNLMYIKEVKNASNFFSLLCYYGIRIVQSFNIHQILNCFPSQSVSFCKHKKILESFRESTSHRTHGLQINTVNQ